MSAEAFSLSWLYVGAASVGFVSVMPQLAVLVMPQLCVGAASAGYVSVLLQRLPQLALSVLLQRLPQLAVSVLL